MRRAMDILALSQLLVFFTAPVFAAADPPCQTEVTVLRGRQVKQVAVERNGKNGAKIVVSNSAPSVKATPPAVVKTFPPIKGKPSTDRDEAWESALREADDRLHEYLREIRPETSWLQKDLRSFVDRMRDRSADRNAPVELTDEMKKEFDGKGLFAAEIHLNLTAPLKEELLRKLRHDEAKERQWWVTKGLLGVLALLATIGIYYRLDDRTKGYYTNLLRLCVVGMLGAAGYGIAHLP